MSMSRIAWLLCILLLPALASASADKKPEESSRGFGYIEMSPAFIVNVGDGKRMAFLKTDVSLRVDTAAADAVRQHMPALRHQLIMMLSGQSIENLQSTEARETLRTAALTEVHGFAGADDYWQSSSAKPWLKSIAVPTVTVNAKNDPFLPASYLPKPSEVSAFVRLEHPAGGGHVGFVSGSFPGNLDWLPQRLLHFFLSETS